MTTIRLIVDTIVAVGVPLSAVLSFLNRGKIHKIYLTMNSRLDQLLETTKASAFAEGRASQTAEVATAAAEVLEKAATKAAEVLETAAKKAE